MKRPSDRALSLADEILDFTTRGLTHEDAVYELAQMIDQMNGDLLEATSASLDCASLTCHIPSAPCLAQLKRVVTEYQPMRLGPDAQIDFFARAGNPDQTNHSTVARVGAK